MSPAPPVQAFKRPMTTNKASEEDDTRPYVVVTEIGKGSFATVYKGYHEETRSDVAVKAVKRDSLSTKLFENLQSEIQILKQLRYRHITKLLDIVRAEKHIYLVMEYCAGGDLTNYIKKRGRVEGLEYVPSPGAAPQYWSHPRTGGLDEIAVRSFLRQLARALKFLRQRNLIHRDIKPQNLLLHPADTDDLARGHPLGIPLLKIADFGFARSLPNAMMAETLCGSPLYMAPEILRYEKYDAKADLWSVGAVLYEMAVGKAPFRAQNHIELLKKIEHSKGIKFPDEDPTSQAGKSGGGGSAELPVPPDIKALIRMLLKRNPAERASFEEFFGSTALAKSKFPKPQESVPAPLGSSSTAWNGGRPPTPEHHKIIPPEVLDPNVMIPPSKFNFRKTPNVPEQQVIPQGAHPSIPRNSPRLQSRPLSEHDPSSAARRAGKGLSTEGSLIPGETEEDGNLRREYVLVGDTRAVEFTKAIDEISAQPRRPLHDRRVPSALDYNTEYPLSPLQINHPPSDGTSNGVNQITFPPPPLTNGPPPLSSSPSTMASRAATNALNRALSIASKKLFGHSSPRGSPSSDAHHSAPSSPRRPPLMPLESDTQRDPLEDQLLSELEELAQKTDVLTHWADEMYEYVKAIPQKPLPDPTKFKAREGEAERQARRRKHADMEAEYNAVTCVAVYMLLMSFSQKGIDRLRNFQEHMNMRHPDGDFIVSDGFDEALNWFREHFIKCNDRAALVKTWLPVTYDGPKSWLDQLVYDRALVLSRTAARKELLDQMTTPDECEKLYEESLWCLYALQDNLLQTGNPFMDEDRETIATWIKRTKLRLVRCRTRMTMTHHDRVNDARADQNLADVARIPAPWDAKPVHSSPLHTNIPLSS
ncbi:hypothetical protein D9619_009962 [Psilocybe cf. subviscida]|uniref:non-specific serine/threonine protein kinase n=1 Tax=Psilocybe cf. subviscida TaxID=2480587 RepID=A0A8H5F6L3_9AGAR|nr:hypothetical protein D9619_009962 [Psilocybe cf. subviscida]